MAVDFATRLEKGIVFAYNGEAFPKGYEDTQEIADSVAKWLKKQGLKGVAEHVGGKNNPTTGTWEHYGGPSRSPVKTDIIIDNYKISVKYGKSKIMTSGEKESTATFKTALANLTDINEDLVDEVFEILSSFVSGVSNDTVGRSKKTDPVLIEGVKVHKKMVASLKQILNMYPDLAREFVKEALTGNVKFGGSEASATHVLSIGSSYKLYDLSDDSVLQKFADSAKVEVDFKSSYSKGKNFGKYRFWSVIKLAVDKIREEYSYQRHDMLSETVANDVWYKIKGYFNTLLNDIKSFISESVDNLLVFLEIEPVITFNNDVEF